MLFKNKKSVINSWKIIYNNFNGMERKTIELVNYEAGKRLIRSEGVNTIFVLPCEKEGSKIEKNAFIIGTFQESKLIRQYVQNKEIPKDGYLYKVIKRPDNQDFRYILFTAFDVQNLFYAACSFFDKYPYENAPCHGGLFYSDGIYESISPEYEIKWQINKMPESTFSENISIKNRCIFAWGHTINDYRDYIKNMARLKINQLIIWNDFLPLNMKEIIDYAHSYNIKIYNGFSWGWFSDKNKITSISNNMLKELKEKIINEYQNEYSTLDADGIYFQSFTEYQNEFIGDFSIAKAIRLLVNDTVKELYLKYPNIKILFGLHATSVKNNLDEIAKVDKRVTIMWEDGGTFPFSYVPEIKSENDFQNTISFMKKILNLRNGASEGLMIKGFLTIDWERFESQPNKFILGENSLEISEFDKNITKKLWDFFSSGWIKYGEYARRFIEIAKSELCDKLTLGMVGKFNDGIYLPEAICSELFVNSNREYYNIVRNVFQRDYVIK